MQAFRLRVCDGFTATVPFRLNLVTFISHEFGQAGVVQFRSDQYEGECYQAISFGLIAFWRSHPVSYEIPDEIRYIDHVTMRLWQHPDSITFMANLVYGKTAGLVTQILYIGNAVAQRRTNRENNGQVDRDMTSAQRRALVGEAVSEFMEECTGSPVPVAARAEVMGRFAAHLQRTYVSRLNGGGTRPFDNLRDLQTVDESLFWVPLTEAARRYLTGRATTNFEDDVNTQFAADGNVHIAMPAQYVWVQTRMVNAVFRNLHDKMDF